MLTDEQLDEVAGGYPAERFFMVGIISEYYGSEGKHGKIVDTSNIKFSSDYLTGVVSKFCSKAGVDYRQNSDGYDEFKINGEWRNVWWMIEPANRAETLAFFDKKLGLK